MAERTGAAHVWHWQEATSMGTLFEDIVERIETDQDGMIQVHGVGQRPVVIHPEVQVDSSTRGSHLLLGNSSAAINSRGEFVVTWMSTDQPSGGDGIYARRFDSTCVPLGQEFLVNKAHSQRWQTT